MWDVEDDTLVSPFLWFRMSPTRVSAPQSSSRGTGPWTFNVGRDLTPPRYPESHPYPEEGPEVSPPESVGAPDKVEVVRDPVLICN